MTPVKPPFNAYCSRVGDAIDDVALGLVTAHLLLIHCLEVAWQALSLHGVHNRGAFLHTLWRVSIFKAEVFEGLAVSCGELKVGGDVAAQPIREKFVSLAKRHLLEVVGVFVLIKQLLHAFQLISLALSKILFVRRTAIEGKRVVRVLRGLLMEDVIFTVVPVGERCMVRACLLNWFRRLNNFTLLWLSTFALLTSILGLVSRDQVHLVRVDDLAFLLEIECFLVALDLSLRELAMEILAIVREQRFWVWVANEAISASSGACTLVTRRKTRNCYST